LFEDVYIQKDYPYVKEFLAWYWITEYH
jgi:hypothetical protein